MFRTPRPFRLIRGLLLLTLALAACTPGAPLFTATPTASPRPPATTPPPSPTTTTPPLPQPVTPTPQLPAAVLAAQAWLAGHLGLPVEQIALVAHLPAEWTDGCLGLGRPDEGCLQAITPGWEVTLAAGGQTYVVRTDQTGGNVRLAAPLAIGELSGTAWALDSFGALGAERPVVGPGTVTLEFSPGGQAAGNAGCNTFSGGYQAQGGVLTFGPLASTKRACAEPGLMEQEQAYLAALQSASGYTLDGDRLTILYPTGVLNFVRPAADQAAWTRQQFGDAWDIAFPPGWSVNAAGEAEGALQLEGQWQGHAYRISLAFPIGLTVESLDAWVQMDLAALRPEQSALVTVSETSVAGIPARLMLDLPAAGEPSSRHRAYIWRTDDHNPRFVEVVQVDGQPFASAAMADFLSRFLAEIHVAPTAAGEARLPGILDFHADGSQGVITAPAAVPAGQDFELIIATYGGGCESAGDEAIVYTPEGAAVFVYDLTVATEPGIACPAILQRLTHTVTLRFEGPGERLIQVWGRRVGPETSGLGLPIVLEHRLAVQ
jgi:heat shock protein HslJ